MGKGVKILSLIILILLILILILFTDITLTANAVKNEQKPYKNNLQKLHTFTKALCNESNFCQDAEITCNNNEVISIKPITGAVVQYSEDWQDPRTIEQIEKLC